MDPQTIIIIVVDTLMLNVRARYSRQLKRSKSAMSLRHSCRNGDIEESRIWTARQENVSLPVHITVQISACLFICICELFHVHNTRRQLTRTVLMRRCNN